MGFVNRRCMVKGCSNKRCDKTWNDEAYSEENPFLCAQHDYDDQNKREALEIDTEIIRDDADQEKY